MMRETTTIEGQNAAVRCRGLVKRYEDVVAVNGLSLDVRRGECFGLLGPNGAGKTTTIEIIEGLTVQDEGTVEILGKTWDKGQDHVIRQRLGVQLQDNKMAERLTVEEVLALFRSFYERGMTIEAALDLFDLRAKRKTRYHKLSGGQKQRLSLACALLNEPELAFLDEPTTGLDPQGRKRVWDMVEAFRARGGTVVLTTHYMEEAEKLCDRLAIVDRGRLILEGSPLELIADLGAEQLVELGIQGSPPFEDVTDLPGITSVTRRNGSLILAITSADLVLPPLLAAISRKGWTLDYLKTHQPTLDDVFLAHTGRALRDD